MGHTIMGVIIRPQNASKNVKTIGHGNQLTEGWWGRQGRVQELQVREMQPQEQGDKGKKGW